MRRAPCVPHEQQQGTKRQDEQTAGERARRVVQVHQAVLHADHGNGCEQQADDIERRTVGSGMGAAGC